MVGCVKIHKFLTPKRSVHSTHLHKEATVSLRRRIEDDDM